MFGLIINSALKDSTDASCPRYLPNSLLYLPNVGMFYDGRNVFGESARLRGTLGKPGAGNKQLMGTYWALAR